MAIVSVTLKPLPAGHAAEFDARGYRCTRVYNVISDAPLTDWPFAIRDAAGLPRVGDLFPGNAFMRVRRVVPKPAGVGADGGAFDVEVHYDTQTDVRGLTTNFAGGTPSAGDTYFVEDPLSRPAQLSWDFEPIQIAKVRATLVSDDDGATWQSANAYLNTAGQTFDPPLTDELYVLVGTLTRNEATYNAALARQYIGAVNSDVWLGLSPRTVKLARWTAQRLYESSVWYWQHTYVIQIHPLIWDDIVLNQGLAYIDSGEGNVLKVARDLDDFAHGQPVNLDANGAIIPAAVPPSPAHYRRFRDQARELPFDVLNIA